MGGFNTREKDMQNTGVIEKSNPWIENILQLSTEQDHEEHT